MLRHYLSNSVKSHCESVNEGSITLIFKVEIKWEREIKPV